MWTHWNGNLINSTSEGVFKETMYDEAELTTAVGLVLKYAAICPQRPEEGNDHDYSDGATVSQLNPGYPRKIAENKLERAIAFLNTARSTPHIPQKITHYMAILECLFSTDASEAVQKVSERTAYYLGSDKASRIEIFKAVKDAYSTRSAFVHGQKVKANYQTASAQSVRIDGVIREVLTRIIASDYIYFLQADKGNAKFLTELIF